VVPGRPPESDCPVGAQHGLDHVTATEQGWVCNGDLVTPAIAKQVGLTRTAYILAERCRATAYPPPFDPDLLRVTLDCVRGLLWALSADLERGARHPEGTQ
jgi:hypothetical protein